MIYTTQESHMACLKKLASQQPREVIISTFNVYAGILHDGDDTTTWGEKYQNDVHDLLDVLSGIKKVRILVGFQPLNLCHKDCEECVAAHYKWAIRLVQHAKHWPKLQWRYVEKCHLKCNLFYYARGAIGVTGGRNLSGSDWTDISFVMSKEQVEETRKVFDERWKVATKVTLKNVEASIECQM
jgi:hypothetical protein